VVLLLILVPPLGIAGAGVALCGAYVVMIAVMHLLTRRAFAAAFEWRRLIQLVAIVGGPAALGDVLLPTHGWVGFLTRAAVLGAIPLLLLLTGFAHPQEIEQAGVLFDRARRGLARESA